MKAALYTKAGPADEVLAVVDLETPSPGVGQVLVRVHAHGVNPTDCKRRSGARGGLPFEQVIPGFDGAGVIEAVGIGVPDRVGERVWIWEGAHRKWDGAAAEFVVVAASRAMKLPDEASFEDGACLGVPAMTACHSLFLAGQIAGEAVLVTGGAGAVGNYAIQLAKLMGAEVITTVRGDADRAEDAMKAGADLVLDSDRDDVCSRVLSYTRSRGVVAVIDVDFGAHVGHAWRMVKQNGTIAAYGSASNLTPEINWPNYMYRNIQICGVAIFEVPEAAKIRAVSFVQNSLVSGKLWHRVDRKFDLSEIALAHQRQEVGRPRGKLIIRPR